MTVDPRNSYTVSSSWVQSQLDEIQKEDSSVRLLEIGCNPERYRRGHIPGAIALNWDHEMSQISGSHRIERETFEEVMGKCGITENTTLILYSDERNWHAFHAFWICWYFGHEKLRLMKGGKSSWEQNGFELTKNIRSVSETTYTVDRRCEGLDCSIVRIG
ncbi:sulfurtransferase [Halohasta litchfieldiae]|jgi:thiosulfate/3-mercaptopyruvate sulfurtransferase|nr:rhodanese-like domain-containing protein [Halohasta litchfieldiae]